MLDVVYNHLGPDGNYLNDFSPDYFTDKYSNDWGRAINFEGPAPARALFVENAGLLDRRVPFRRAASRRDAGHQGRVPGARHRATRQARARSRRARRVMLVAENEPQDTRFDPAARARRLRPRRALERRLSPQRRGCADRPPRGLLHRLHRVGAGVRLDARSTATSTRASGTRGRSRRAARRRSI